MFMCLEVKAGVYKSTPSETSLIERKCFLFISLSDKERNKRGMTHSGSKFQFSSLASIKILSGYFRDNAR